MNPSGKSSSGDRSDRSDTSEAKHEHDEECPGSVDERILAAWHVWLSALATDPEAALAAALAYQALDDHGRKLWLDALEQDAPHVDVPRVAMYAPLLSVEIDPARRARIQAALGGSVAIRREQAHARALRGIAPNSDRLVAIVLPLYLDFVRTIACRFRPNDGFTWVKHDPILRDGDAPREKSSIEGVVLERTPLQPVIDELAHAVLAHRRSGQTLPDGLRLIVDLFDLVPSEAP